jgi:hypothetical protein
MFAKEAKLLHSDAKPVAPPFCWIGVAMNKEQ